MENNPSYVKNITHPKMKDATIAFNKEATPPAKPINGFTIFSNIHSKKNIKKSYQSRKTNNLQ